MIRGGWQPVGAQMNKTEFKVRFGGALRALRHTHGFSQQELADRSGLHRTYIADVERGARNISLEAMTKLAHGLQVSIREFFPDQDSVATVQAAL